MYNHKEGITFRKLERTDLNDLLALKNESWWGTHSTQILNLDDQNKWFDSIPQNQLFLIGSSSSNPNESIGVAVYTDIDLINRSLKISGSLFKKFRGQFSYRSFCAGLDFAFEMLNVNRVEAEVLEYHVTARILEINKLGFFLEGTKRQSVYKCGRYYNSLCLGMLREDWMKSDRVVKYGDTCNLNFSPDRFNKIIKRMKL